MVAASTHDGADGEALRLGAIRGVYDHEKGVATLGNGAMSFLYALRWGAPTWLFHSLFQGYYTERAKTAPHRLNPDVVWRSTKAQFRSSAMPVFGTVTTFMLLRNAFANKYGLDATTTWVGPLAICAAPAAALAVKSRAMPPPAWIGGLFYAFVLHFYSTSYVEYNSGWKGAPSWGRH